MTAPQLDKQEVLASIDFPAAFQSLAPGGHTKGNEYHHLCPFHDDKNIGNASTNINTGQGKCLSCGAGWDFFKLLMKARGISTFPEALRVAADEFGNGLNGKTIQLKTQKTQKKSALQIVMPVPTDAPALPEKHFKYGMIPKSWTYKDINGKELGHVVRFDPEGQRKQILPLTLWKENGKLVWKWKQFPAPRPLYFANGLSFNMPILVIEGEKTADAAHNLAGSSYDCVSWPGGSNALSKADFSILQGRNCVLWPDNDEPGKKAMEAIAGALFTAGAKSVKIVRPPDGRPEKWDLADAETEGWTTEKTLKWIEDYSTVVEKPCSGIVAKLIQSTEFKNLLSPTEYIIKDFIVKGLYACLIGKWASYKTFMAISWACSLSFNKSWYGRNVKRTPVLYIAGEAPQSIIRRVVGWKTHNEIKDDPGLFFLYPEPIFFLNNKHAEQAKELLQHICVITGQKPFVFIDTLNRNFGAGDENSTKDMTTFTANIDHYIKPDCCGIMLLHHPGHNGSNRGRGSSSLPGALDTEYIMTREEDGKGVELFCSKMKDAPEPQSQFFSPHSVELPLKDEDGKTETTLVLLSATKPVKLKDKQKDLAELVKSQQGAFEGVCIDVVADQAREEKIYATKQKAKAAIKALVEKHVLIENPQGFVMCKLNLN